MRFLATTVTILCAAVALGMSVPLVGLEEARAQDEAGDLAIYGTVMVPGTREPVSNVSVSLRGPGSGGFAQGNSRQTTMTDATGRFSFTGLSAARYDLTAEGMPGRVSTTLNLDSGMPSPDVAVWQFQTSEISGRVTDADGKPVVGAVVDAMRPVWQRGRRTLGSVAIDLEPAVTNERGSYTMTVPVGDYYLRVDGAASRLWVDGASLPPHYYPNALTPESAVLVSVRHGIDLQRMDVSLVSEEQFRVQFRLSVPDSIPGVPQPLSSYLEPAADPVEAWVRPSFLLGRIDTGAHAVDLEAGEDDTWITSHLPPGSYELLIRRPVALRYSLGRVVDWDQYDPRWTELDVISWQQFVVEDADLDLDTISPNATLSAMGRVVVRSTGPETISPADISAVSFFRSDFATRSQSPVASDGAFDLVGLYPGVWDFRSATGLPDGWRVASVRSGARNVLKDGLEVGGVVSFIEIVISDDGAGIQGVVRDADDALLPDARLVLIPPATERGPFARFPTVEADANGVYSVSEVAPGEYRLLAFDPAGRDDFYSYWESPEFLREYELRGELIRVDPGAQMAINAEAILLSD